MKSGLEDIVTVLDFLMLQRSPSNATAEALARLHFRVDRSIPVDIKAHVPDKVEEITPITVNGVTLHRDGKPITAGQLKQGQSVTFDPITGEVLS